MEPSLPLLAIEYAKDKANAAIDDPTTCMAPLHGELRAGGGHTDRVHVDIAPMTVQKYIPA